MIENLHMNGLDEKGEPYSLTATRALQSTDSKNIIDLVKPLGELTLKSGTWLAGKAEQGRFDQNTDKLWLGGDVEFFHDGGYQFTTSDAQFDLKNNLAWGERPVVIQGAFGVIHGQGFRILSGGKVVIVTGHSTATLNLRNAQPSDKPAVDKANSQMER